MATRKPPEDDGQKNKDLRKWAGEKGKEVDDRRKDDPPADEQK